MALALVLDTADGHLARLQGTSSAFGRWLDEFLDELGDLALHAAIAWSAFARDGRPVWLLLGIAYASGKYLFRVQSSLGDELERRRRCGAASPDAGSRARIGRGLAAARAPGWGTPTSAGTSGSSWPRSGGSTWRWSLTPCYFPARTLAGAIRKGGRHALSPGSRS